MPAAGVAPDAETKRALSKSEMDLGKMRTAKLRHWLGQGGEEATAAARVLLQNLIDRYERRIDYFFIS